ADRSASGQGLAESEESRDMRPGTLFSYGARRFRFGPRPSCFEPSPPRYARATSLAAPTIAPDREARAEWRRIERGRGSTLARSVRRREGHVPCLARAT